jgi:hypothetical protein
LVDSFELEKKERYKALSMKIEVNSAEQTWYVIWNTIEKLVKKINLDSYKKAIKILKEKMWTWDMEAFWEYSEVVKEAKKMGLK